MKLLVVMLLILLPGCSWIVEEPQVAVKDVKLMGLDSGGVKMEVQLSVTNPNRFTVRLEGYSYEVKVLTLPLAKGGARNSVSFTPGSTTVMLVPVRVAFADLWEIVKRRPHLDDIPYQLSCGVELETPFGRQIVPVEQAGVVAVPEKYRLSGMLREVGELFLRE